MTLNKSIGYFTDFEQVKNLAVILPTLNKSIVFFTDFEQVKNFLPTLNNQKLSSHFADFEQVTKTNNKNPLGEAGCLCIFFFLFLAISSRQGHSTLASQTCEGLHQLWALPWHLAFFWMLSYPQFFNSLTCDLQDAIPRQRLPTLILREAEDFPRGDNHSKHVPLSTYLASLQPIYYNSQIHIYTCQNCKSFACGEDINKKHRAAATLISSHESK